MKKFSAVAVTLVLLLSASFIPSAALATDAGYDNPELARAVSLGLGQFRSGDPAVTYAEFMTMLDKAVALSDHDRLEAWRERFPEARQSNKTINRGNAILGVFAAAETLGGEVYARNSMDAGEGAYEGQWAAESYWGDVERVPVGFEGLTDDPNNGDFLNWASHYVTSRASVITGKPVFDYQNGRKNVRADEDLPYEEALTAALRFYESSITITERFPTPQDEQILANARERKHAILGSETDIAYTGAAYYVANHGNDKNDGKSPEKPWATLARVNKAKAQKKLKPGDAVFFHRGDLWRGYLDCARGVAYSAYGTGEKPKIYGSTESGADPSKWKLWYDENGVKIWQFYRDITEVGNIVFNGGASYALRAYAFYNGKDWVISGEDQRPFDIVRELKHDLRFYSTFPLSKSKYKQYAKRLGGTVCADSIDTTGQLYLRCDKGNPGELYEEMEFHTTPKGLHGYVGLVNPSGDNVIDNLCIQYSLCNGIAIYGEGDLNRNNDNNVIQNCEIAWTGGTQHDLNRPEGDVMVCGECIVFKTDGNVFRNNYIHQGACAGIVSEFVGNEHVPGNTLCENTVVEGNLLERCQDALWFWDNGYPGDDIVFWNNTTIADNLVMHMGYGWSGDPIFAYPSNITNTYHKEGETWSFAIGGNPSGVKNMLVENNVFYLSNGGWIVQIPDMYGGSCDVTFSGNTYVQHDNRKILTDHVSLNSLTPEDIRRDIEQYLGDKTAIIFPTSVIPAAIQ